MRGASKENHGKTCCSLTFYQFLIIDTRGKWGVEKQEAHEKSHRKKGDQLTSYLFSILSTVSCY